MLHFFKPFKSFRTVYHKILINNVNSYSILGNMQSLLSNYLTNRNQYTECNGIESKVNLIYCGIARALR